MNDEIMRILKMVEEGTISADKAKEIIEALENSSKNTVAIIPKKYDDKFFKIEVLSHAGDKVNVKLPIKVVKELIKITGKLPISSSIEGLNGVNLDDLMNTIVSCIDNEVMDEIVNVHSCDGDTVRIVIE